MKMYSMFASTYICESMFSDMKIIKTKYRNRLSDEHLETLLKISRIKLPLECLKEIK